MDLGTRAGGAFKPHAYLHALYGLDGHEAEGEPRVELPVPLHVAAETRGDAGGGALESPAQAVSGLLCLVYAPHHGLRGLIVRAPHLGTLGHLKKPDWTFGRKPGVHAAYLDDPAVDVYAEGVEEPLRERPSRDPHRGLPRARSLEYVTEVPVAVLEPAREVGVPRPRPRDLPGGALQGGLFVRGHYLFPVLPVPVAHDERNGRAERVAVPYAGGYLHGIGLYLHPCAPAVAALPPFEVGVYVPGRDAHSGWQALYYGCKEGPGGVPGGPAAWRSPPPFRCRFCAFCFCRLWPSPRRS